MQFFKTVLVGFGISLAACATQDKGAEKPELSPEQQALQERQSAAGGAATAVQRFEQSKQDYIQKAEDDLNDLEAKVAALKASAPADPAERENHMATVATLEENVTKARTQLEEARQANIQDWDTEQRQTEQAILTARAAYDAAAMRIAH